MLIVISNHIFHFTINGRYHYILWQLDVRENHNPRIFYYAICIFPLFQKQGAKSKLAPLGGLDRRNLQWTGVIHLSIKPNISRLNSFVDLKAPSTHCDKQRPVRMVTKFLRFKMDRTKRFSVCLRRMDDQERAARASLIHPVAPISSNMLKARSMSVLPAVGSLSALKRPYSRSV